jgi:MtrB/PioB family decaheme-associated outer membrane protein
MAQQPDNKFQQLSLSGAYFANPWDTVLAFSAAVGKGEQNSTLLPYTINPNIDAGPLPQSSLNGEVDTANYALTLTARPTNRARLKFAYRVDERNNKTAQSDWTRVIVDIFDSGDPSSNTPYSFNRMRLNLAAYYRLSDTLRVSGGYDRKELERDFQEVAEQTEDAGWGQVRWQPNAGFDLRAKVGTAKRDIDRYDESVSQSLGQNPLMRKYNLAYRYRKYAEIAMSAAMLDSPFSISATVLAADDSYTESRLGMTDSDEFRATVDFSWAISEHSSAYLMFGAEETDASQLGSERSAGADWRADHEDSFNFVGIGVRWRQLTERLDLLANYSHGVGDTKIAVTSLSFAGESRLPDLASTLNSLQLEGHFRWTDRLDATFNLRFERFSAEDWALQDVAPDTLPTILTLGAEPYDYNVWALGIGFRYRFGIGDIALIN